MFQRLLGARRGSAMIALNAQIGQTHELFMLLGETRATAFLARTLNRLAHRASAAAGLVARVDRTSLLILFERAEDALRATCLLREELRHWCQDIDRRLRLNLDMGLSAGAVMCRPPRYEGETILRASSLATLACDGQILLDAGVVEQLPEDLRLGLESATSSGPDGVRRAWIHRCPPMRSDDPSALWMHVRRGNGGPALTFTPERPIRIGRDERSDIVLDLPDVSRQHAVITWRNGRYMLADTSQNGTWVQSDVTRDWSRLSHSVGVLTRGGSIRFGRPPEPGAAPDLAFVVTEPEGRAEWPEAEAGAGAG